MSIDSNQQSSTNTVPLFAAKAAGGTPIAVENSIAGFIDINELLVSNPNSTFYAKVVSATNFYGIHNEDIVIVDTQAKVSDGVFVCTVDNDNLFINKFHNTSLGAFLESNNGDFIPVNNEFSTKSQILGVVTKVIHTF